MKVYLTVIALCTMGFCFGQKRTYVQIGPAAYINTKGATGFIGGGIGAGSSIGLGGAGINVELLSRNKQLILPVYADMRFYFRQRINSPYVTLQPGYNFRNSQEPIKPHSTTKDKGGLYLGAGFGFFVFDKERGVNFQLRYIFLQDRYTTITTLADNYVRRQVLNVHEGLISFTAFVMF